MAKPKEDNRDVFEKALDNADVIGALAGGAAALALGRRNGLRFRRNPGVATAVTGAGAGFGLVPGSNVRNDHLKRKKRKK